MTVIRLQAEERTLKNIDTYMHFSAHNFSNRLYQGFFTLAICMLGKFNNDLGSQSGLIWVQTVYKIW